MIIGRRTLVVGGVAVGLAAAVGIVQRRHRGVSREPGLVGHWKFDETTGDTVLDSSGLGNDGTIVPSGLPDAAKRGAGAFADSVSLSGTADNFVSISASDTLNRLKSELTVVAHVYPRTQWAPGGSSDGFVALVQRQWRTVMHPDLFYLGYGVEQGRQFYKWHVGLVGSEASLYKLPADEARPRAGGWVHLTGTFSSSAGEMTLYVDGKSIGTQKTAGEIRLDEGSFDRPLAIGAELNGEYIDETSGNFDGYVDEVRLYDRALTETEVSMLARDARSRLAAPAAQP